MRTRIATVVCSTAVLALVLLSASIAMAQSGDALVKELERRWEQRRPALYYQLLQGNPLQQLNAGQDILLMGINGRGLPMYYITHNVTSAQSIRTSDVWPSGLSGYNLAGVDTPPGVLGIWDGGLANPNHIEFVGRSYQADGWPYESDHATHVAGTMVGAGLDAAAGGPRRRRGSAAHPVPRGDWWLTVPAGVRDPCCRSPGRWRRCDPPPPDRYCRTPAGGPRGR